MSTAVHISLEEFLVRPDREDNQREELLEGELLVSPSAKLSHAMIVTRLRIGLTPLEHKGFMLVNDSACIVGQSMPIPDLAAIAQSRIQPTVDKDGWLEGSPELVIEVSSSSNLRLHRKADIYLDYGAEQVWIVYPKTKTVTVVTAEGSIEARLGEELEFHGVQVPVTSIFPNR